MCAMPSGVIPSSIDGGRQNSLLYTHPHSALWPQGNQRTRHHWGSIRQHRCIALQQYRQHNACFHGGEHHPRAEAWATTEGKEGELRVLHAMLRLEALWHDGFRIGKVLRHAMHDPLAEPDDITRRY